MQNEIFKTYFGQYKYIQIEKMYIKRPKMYEEIYFNVYISHIFFCHFYILPYGKRVKRDINRFTLLTVNVDCSAQKRKAYNNVTKLTLVQVKKLKQVKASYKAKKAHNDLT